jgi:DNA-binding NtrC family response regulator
VAYIPFTPNSIGNKPPYLPPKNSLGGKVHIGLLRANFQFSLQIGKDTPIDLTTILYQLEHDILVSAINLAKGNKAEAATMLRLKRTTLVEKMRRHGLPLEKPRRRMRL